MEAVVYFETLSRAGRNNVMTQKFMLSEFLRHRNFPPLLNWILQFFCAIARREVF
jgi:hypothetical protein